jgi:hypothetical protein
MTETRRADVLSQSGPLARWPFGPRGWIAYTVLSALAVWLSLAVAEGLAKEQCQRDGLAFNWTTWSCKNAGGTIILPPGLRRAGSD